jgi:ribosomal protein S18 acetylase RimI-like enzyme
VLILGGKGYLSQKPWSSISRYEVSKVTISEIGVDRLDSLRELWLALHRHHAAIGSQPLVTDEDLSWQRRRALYESWLLSQQAFVLIAGTCDEPVGYAVVRLHDGPDDTYPVGASWAEIYSLSVDPQARGHGIGTLLLDAIDERLTALGIHDVTISAMVENESALRLYQRRGFVPRELMLWRFAD